MRATALVDGFPAKSSSHGGLGWSSVWLLEDDSRCALVETGPPVYAPGLVASLSEHGLHPEDVTDVLITHCHWDHLYNITMFPEARWWIGADEMEWARSLGPGEPFVSPLHVNMLSGDRLHLLHDGDELWPGARAIATAGHTPGHMAYVIQAQRTLIFAGDAVKNIHELSTGNVDMTLDRPASEASVATLWGLMADLDAWLVPGHDVPLVLDGGTARRVASQQAQLSVFASPKGDPEIHTISAEGES